jgi:uncharacterized protein (TIGR00255 family)
MAVYSMTGYASLQANPEVHTGQTGCQIGMEIRSVNSRFLDLTFKLNDELRPSEPALRELLSKAFKRGKIEVRGWIEGKSDSGTRLPSSAELQRLNALQDTVVSWLPQARPLSVAEVIHLTGRNQPPSEDQNERFLNLADTAILAMKESRAREGERLTVMLNANAQQLMKLAEKATPLVPELVEQQRQRFLSRWNEAMGTPGHSVDQTSANERALTEATAFAIRIDVAEELTRLRSHLQEIQQLLKKGGELGKRLDFLIQELHREANTLGSKSSSLELTRISVDMKVLIEQMREQVQNIE